MLSFFFVQFYQIVLFDFPTDTNKGIDTLKARVDISRIKCISVRISGYIFCLNIKRIVSSQNGIRWRCKI